MLKNFNLSFWVVCSALVVSGAAQAKKVTYDVQISAAGQCLDTSSLSISGVATLAEVPPGLYSVSLVDNTMDCGSGDGSCRIDTVIISTPPQGGNAAWGLSVKEGKSSQVNITGISSMPTAFVVDDNCADNYGSAVLRFKLKN